MSRLRIKFKLMNANDGYVPSPADLSGVELPGGLEELTELIAENVHEVWAAARVREGWIWGPERNDRERKHPCLVPYAELPEEEKQRRADIIMRAQANISAAKLEEKMGKTLTVICDGIDEESGLYLCRSEADAPEIDGNVCVSSEDPMYPGEFYQVYIEESDMYDLYGYVVEDEKDESAQ